MAGKSNEESTNKAMKEWSTYLFSDRPFAEKAQAVFDYQYAHNPVYRRYCEALAGGHEALTAASAYNKMPLLPIRAFKDADMMIPSDGTPSLRFESSGTSGMEPSVHEVANESIYRASVLQGFREFYDLEQAVFLGYTPGYADNPHSSLIWMIHELIKQDNIKKSRFLPLDAPLSQGEVDDIAASGRQLILFGAAFGLIDLVEQSEVQLPSNSIVLETGGMKTHRREMERATMHQLLANGFGLDASRIHSEYGMCELLSQAYATGGKWFRTVPWMQVSVRRPDDPSQLAAPYEEGILGVIDLANVHSCSFLLTGDRGMMDRNGRFQVLGRWEPTDVRGCNFLIDED